jgi:hypothetical protein
MAMIARPKELQQIQNPALDAGSRPQPRADSRAAGNSDGSLYHTPPHFLYLSSGIVVWTSQAGEIARYAIIPDMTKLLQEAIETLRDLPEDEQDAAADALFAYIASDERQYRLHPDQAEAVRRTQRDLKTGKTRLATGDEVDELKKKSGL